MSAEAAMHVCLISCMHIIDHVCSVKTHGMAYLHDHTHAHTHTDRHTYMHTRRLEFFSVSRADKVHSQNIQISGAGVHTAILNQAPDQRLASFEQFAVTCT